MAEIRTKVIQAFTAAGSVGLTTDNIVNLLMPHTDDPIKATQNVLYRLGKAGVVTRKERGLYVLVSQQKAKSAKTSKQEVVSYDPKLNPPEQVLVVTHARKEGITPAEWVRNAVKTALRRARD